MPRKTEEDSTTAARKKGATATKRAPGAKVKSDDAVPKPQPAPVDPSAPELPILDAPPPAQVPAEIPVRMLNEFVYCPRLFFYEFVEGVFVDNADTIRGSAAHKRVDGGKGKLEPAKGAGEESDDAAPDVIHTRSVSLGSEGLGITAKLDLVEVRRDPDDLFSPETVCPVEYKVGAPKEDEDTEAMTLWDADKMQLGLQILILRDNGYACDEGVLYYRATRQRVRLPMSDELENWIRQTVEEARMVAQGPIPPPLEDSPKCPRCSLVTVCLPDETGMLGRECGGTGDDFSAEGDSAHVMQEEKSSHAPLRGKEIRRLIAARNDKRAVYLSTPGLFVGKSGQVLRMTEKAGRGAKAKKKMVQEIPLNDVDHVALFGNVQMSTQVIRELCKRELPVTYFSTGGYFYGLTRGHELKNVFLRMRQFAVAADEAAALPLAREFVAGKIRNQRVMLRRNHIELPDGVLKRLKRAADDDCAATANKASLLGVEGAAASVYFKHFGGMLKVEKFEARDSKSENSEGEGFGFDFAKRNRRPPRDPVNALLSLAYSLLAKDCTVLAATVGFDPYVGLFHEPRFGRPALALDIMEEFRPLIADSVVISAIGNGIFAKRDFVQAGNAVNLTAKGRGKFFSAYERRMSNQVTHPVFGYKVSYRRAIELQFRILARVLTGEIPKYIAFTTR